MKSNSILDITAVCIGLIVLSPVGAAVLTMYNNNDIDRGIFGAASLILLTICTGISVGARLVMEIIADKVTEAFPTLPPLVLIGSQFLLLFGFLLLLLLVSVFLLPEGEHLIMVCFCFLFACGSHFGAMQAYSS